MPAARLVPLVVASTLAACNAPVVETEVTVATTTAPGDGLTDQASLVGTLMADASTRDTLETFAVRATVSGGPLDAEEMGSTITLYAGLGQGRRKITFGRERVGPAEATWDPVDLVNCQETGGTDDPDGTCTIGFEIVVETDAPAAVDVSLWLGAWGKVRRNERKALTLEATLVAEDG